MSRKIQILNDEGKSVWTVKIARSIEQRFTKADLLKTDFIEGDYCYYVYAPENDWGAKIGESPQMYLFSMVHSGLTL